MARPVSETRERQGIVCPAALMIDAQSIRPRESPGHTLSDYEREGSSDPRDNETVLARSFETRKVCFER
jgi:hypothetical protein